jgi:pyruvate dehydrogenase E2 component (dihydrolipoamide acetyltransferase)
MPDGWNNDSGHRSAATPLARRMAAAHALALDDIRGTGPLGRITRSDVLKSAGLELRAAPSLPTVRGGAPAGSWVVPTVPRFQVQTKVVMDAAISLCAELKPVAGEGGTVPTLNDVIIKAAAMALREYPLANGSCQDDRFLLHDEINVGIAVAVHDLLVVSTLFDVSVKSLGQIALETRALAARVRSGEITAAQFDGGTFIVSNPGMFGVTAFTPNVNSPQAGILGVGALGDTPPHMERELDRTLLTLTLFCHHRIPYAADAASFLACIRELIEAPTKLVL